MSTSHHKSPSLGSCKRKMFRWLAVPAAVLTSLLAGCASMATAQVGPLNTFLNRDGKSRIPKPSIDSVLRWTDQLVFHHWRIQSHVETGEHRLVDADGKVRHRGTFAECQGVLEQLKRDENLPPMQGECVLLLHGLAAPSWSMGMLARHLEKEGNFTAIPLDQASLRSNIDQLARSLASVVQHLDGIEKVHLVGHSLGNIVIRRYLAGNPDPETGWAVDRRIGRIVMIAPPNHGSLTASRLADFRLFKSLFGEIGQELGANWQELESRLATPLGEFGIIAGGLGNRVGFDPFQPGDDDGRISVATTRLAGATDFIVVAGLHELIAHDPRVLDYTLSFLENGYFVAADQRHPILAAEIPEEVPGGARRR